MSKIRTVLCWVSVAVGLNACAGDSPEAPSIDTPFHSSTFEAPNMRLVVSTLSETFATGTAVEISLAIYNDTDEPQQYNFASTQQRDVSVRQNGSTVWNWAAGVVFLGVLTSIQLDPGETFVFEQTWDQRTNANVPVAPGTYQIVGLIPTISDPVQGSELTITIE